MGCGEDRHEHIGFEAFLIFFFGLGGHKLLHIFSTDVNGLDGVGWFGDEAVDGPCESRGSGACVVFPQIVPKSCKK